MNYSELVSAIQQITEDDDTELATFIPTAIQLAEDRIYRDAPRMPAFDTEDTGTMTASVATITPPSNIRIPGSFRITSGTSEVFLEQREKTYVLDFAPDDTATGQPEFYAIENATTWRLAPVPDANYAYTISHYAITERLTSGNTTTWLATNAEDALLFASLIEVNHFLKYMEKVTEWTARYAEAMSKFGVEIQSTYNEQNTAGVR